MAIPRTHRLLPHTADAGLEASAPTLPALFEEAALALADLTSDRAAEAIGSTEAPIELVAPDLPALAFAWLGELIGLIDARASAVSVTDVRTVEPVRDGWRLVADIRLAPFDGVRVRRRDDVKSVTYHGLVVEPAGGGWRLVAYLDV